MISLLVSLVVLALCYWLITLLPLPEPFPIIIRVVVVIIAIVYILRFVGVVIF